MRRGLFAFFAVVVLLAWSGMASAEISSFIYQVPAPELRTSGEQVYFGVEGFGSSTTPYYPVVPTKSVHYEIPFAAENVSVSVTPMGREALGTFANYLMRTPPMLLGDPTYQPPPRPDKIPDVSPAEFFAYTGERQFRGHHLVEIVLYPVQYNSVTGEAAGVSSYSIAVTYSMPVDAAVSEEMSLPARATAFEPLARDITENYDEANQWFMKRLMPEDQPQDAPDLLGSGHIPGVQYDLSNPAYAIITNSTLQSYAQTLADWKTKKGVPAAVYTVSWITSNYSGYDTQEKIRNFLRLDSSTPRFQYVLLMGDTGIIPERECYSDADGDMVPCDYYFSDVVDGAIGASYDWDTDNDHVWGEIDDDTITWLPDNYVGRMAITSTTDANTIVTNILNYEKAPPAGTWVDRVVFGSAFANFLEHSGYDPTDMATVAEFVRTDFLIPAGVAYERLYEGAGVYPSTYTRDYDLTATNFRDRVAVGCGLAFPSGHGNYLGNYRTVWTDDYDEDGYCDDGETTSYPLCTQSYNPSTGGKKPYVLVGACLAGEFDRSAACLGDFIIANWGIGAVASSRTSYYCVGWNDPDWPWNQGQEYRWWEQIYTYGKYRMGQIHGDNKYHYVQDFNSIEGGIYGPDQEPASRKNMFSSNLFGDPELPIWTDTPTSIVVAHNSTLPIGSSSYSVTVTSGGSALSGATVCLWKGSEVYLVGTTNSSGVAAFAPSPSSAGTMYVTVTKHNYIPYEGSATVVAGDTTPPTVVVNAPNGGENWWIGSTQNVNWTATDNTGVTSITIVLSRDGGTTYADTLAKGEVNDSVYPWLVTAPPSATARIKVIAYDAAGNSGSDVSNADFAVADGTPPSITVTSPNGGEGWGIGSTQNVTWTATDNIGVTSITVILSRDGALTFPDTLAKGEANDGVYPWLVTAPPSATTRIKVIAYDAAGNLNADMSNANFAIADTQAPSVTVNAPNGGETWDIGTSYGITWTASDNIGVTSISILLSDDGGATYPDTLATGEANDGVYAWLVDRPATFDARVKVIAYDAAGNSGQDASDADFEIYDPASGVPVDEEIPARLVLAGNVPNPFSEVTAIRFGLPANGRVEVDVYDVSGRRVVRLAEGEYQAGYHRVRWNSGSARGIYFVKVRFGEEEATRKVVVSR